MKPYPFEASNHLMTPEISTRLAVSPRPDNASSGASRPVLPGKSPDPSRLPDVPPDIGTPFLDSNPSDPITPDLTHHFAVHRAFATAPKSRSTEYSRGEARESLESK